MEALPSREASSAGGGRKVWKESDAGSWHLCLFITRQRDPPCGASGRCFDSLPLANFFTRLLSFLAQLKGLGVFFARRRSGQEVGRMERSDKGAPATVGVDLLADRPLAPPFSFQYCCAGREVGTPLTPQVSLVFRRETVWLTQSVLG